MSFELPKQVMSKFYDTYSGYEEAKEFDIEKLVKDNDLLIDEDLESYHQKQWDNKKAKDFKIDQNKVNNMSPSEIPYITVKKDGRWQIGDGRHRIRALHNEGYTTIKLPYRKEK